MPSGDDCLAARIFSIERSLVKNTCFSSPFANDLSANVPNSFSIRLIASSILLISRSMSLRFAIALPRCIPKQEPQHAGRETRYSSRRTSWGKSVNRCSQRAVFRLVRVGQIQSRPAPESTPLFFRDEHAAGRVDGWCSAFQPLRWACVP